MPVTPVRAWEYFSCSGGSGSKSLLPENIDSGADFEYGKVSFRPVLAPVPVKILMRSASPVPAPGYFSPVVLATHHCSELNIVNWLLFLNRDSD